MSYSNPRIKLKQHIIERDPLRIGLVGEKRVGIDQGRRSNLEEGQERRDVGQEILMERISRGRVRGGEDVDGVGGGDHDPLVEAEGGKGGLDRGHGKDQGLDEDGVVDREDLIADSNDDDLGFGEVEFDVVSNPGEGGSEVVDAGYGAVVEADDELDVGIGEALEDYWADYKLFTPP